MKRKSTDYDSAFLDVHGVAKRYDVKPATVWQWMARGKFPQPIRLTAGCSRWSMEDLREWEDQKRAECAPRHEWEERERRKRMREMKA